MNKTVQFTGADNGILALMEKIKASNEALYNKTISNARKVSDSGKQQLSYIEMQAKALERKNKQLEKEKNLINENHIAAIKAVNEQQKLGNISRSEADRQRAGLINSRNDSIANINAQIPENEKIVGLFRELIDTVRLTASEQIAEDKKTIQQRVTLINVSNAQYQLSDEAALIQGQQSDALRGQKSPESIFGAILKAEAVKGIVRGVAGFAQNVAQNAVGAESGDAFLMQSFTGFNPFGIPVGSILGGAGMRSIQQQFEVQNQQARLRGRMGKSYGGFSGRTDLGFSTAESLPIAEQYLTARGGGNAQSLFNQGATLERAFTLDRGLVAQLFKDMRTTTDTATVLQNTAEVIKMVPGLKDDKVKLQEILELQSNITQQQGEVVQSVNKSEINKVIGGVSGIGKRFTDDPQFTGRIIQSLNQSLTSPSSEFAKANNMMALSELMPGASYVEILKAQEKGIFQSGLMDKTMEQMARMYGGDSDSMTLALKSRTGLSTDISEQIVKAYLANPDLLSGFKGSGDELMSVMKIKGAAGKNVGERDIDKARIDDAFLKSGSAGLSEVFSQGASEITEAIKSVDLKMETFLGDFDFGEKLINVLNKLSNNNNSTKPANE